VAKDWEKVGIKTVVQIRERALHFKMRDANELMAEIWNQDTTGFPFTGNTKFDIRIPAIQIGNFGPLHGQWYRSNGADGVEPPAQIKKLVELIDTAKTVGGEQQIKVAQDLFKIWADEVYEVGIVGLTPMIQGVVVLNSRMRNVPTQVGNDWPLRTPGNARPEQFFYQR
jgi:peptide/nickel transport system substrate-binding protein